jgi:hypothetical protein
MNREQKIAVMVIIVAPIGLLFGLTGILMRQFGSGVSKIPFALAGIIGFCAVILSLQFIKKDIGAVTFDERDKIMGRNADLAGFGAVYLVVILASIVPPMINPEARIPTTWFPGLLCIAGLFQGFARSLSVLIQYGQGGKDGGK